jgi:ATP/maltotriose-dependent transcriptional regulator MalT
MSKKYIWAKLIRSETSKITGMLLELSHEEVTELFNDEEKFKIKVDEANRLLRQTAGQEEKDNTQD